MSGRGQCNVIALFELDQLVTRRLAIVNAQAYRGENNRDQADDRKMVPDLGWGIIDHGCFADARSSRG